MKDLFVLLVVITSLTSISFAQDRQKESEDFQAPYNQTEVQNDKFNDKNTLLINGSGTNFELDMLKNDHIDLKYTGYKIDEVIEEINKLKAVKKGEFEKTIDYNTRKERKLKEPFLNNTTINDMYGFIVPFNSSNSFSSPFSYAYNADTEEVLLNINCNKKM